MRNLPPLAVYDLTGTVYRSRAGATDNRQFVVGFVGRHGDQLVKADGRWRIESRELVSSVPPATR
jgi:hypothetical protein